MVELIVVMILIGILGTIAASRFFERSSFDTVAWSEQVKATLRYAQKVAIAQNTPVYVHLNADRIAVCTDSDAACPVLDRRVRAPGGANSGSAATRSACASGSWMCEGRPAAVAMRQPGDKPVTGSVAFDGLGRAALSGGFAGRLEFKGDGILKTVAIDPESGYVD